MNFHRTAFLQALSYVDFEDVVALDGHIKTTILDIESLPLSMEDGRILKYSFIESEIKLEDSLWQIFSEP